MTRRVSAAPHNIKTVSTLARSIVRQTGETEHLLYGAPGLVGACLASSLSTVSGFVQVQSMPQGRKCAGNLRACGLLESACSRRVRSRPQKQR